jgi:DNA uptake protein ComE-like DNA-binding protein
MHSSLILSTTLGLALISAPAFAQDTKPAPSPARPPVTSTPLAAPKPSTTGAATAPVAAKTNLNTATAAELDKLPKVGPVQAKAIMEARGKSKFKDWDDFVARKVVPAETATAIKDVIVF